VAAHEDLVSVQTKRFAERVGKRAFEQAFDRRLIGTGADEVARAPGAAEQRQRLKDDALPGSGLTGDDVQAPGEGERQILDDREVADAQLAEHGCSLIRP
jgi:hypothetical protein